MTKDKIDTATFVDTLLNTTVNEEYSKNKASQDLQTKLLDVLCCPKCLTPIKKDADELICSLCGKKYKVKEGISLMYTNEKDDAYLIQKWNHIYKNKFGFKHKNMMQLIKTFEHTKIKPNFLTRRIIRRILKIHKFMYNSHEILKERSISGIFAYFLGRTRRRIQRELNRLINRF